MVVVVTNLSHVEAKMASMLMPIGGLVVVVSSMRAVSTPAMADDDDDDDTGRVVLI